MRCPPAARPITRWAAAPSGRSCIHPAATHPAVIHAAFPARENLSAARPPAAADAPAGVPTPSTSIFGIRDAVLVAPLMAVPEATALAAWVRLHARRLTTIYITHGHGDH